MIERDGPAVTVEAAGAVVWRRRGSRIEVLVVRRSAYDDVTIPKGKVDPGESVPQTAVREILEETGLEIRLGAPLGQSRYSISGGRTKLVHYWAAKATRSAQARSRFTPNDEISAIEWLSVGKARRALSYDLDREILARFTERAERGQIDTFAVIIARHGKAEAYDAKPVDADRVLVSHGRAQADALGQTLPAWGPKKIISSRAMRCMETVTPLARVIGRAIVPSDAIAQAPFEASEADVPGVIARRLARAKSVVLCSHGPVIPALLAEIARRLGHEVDAELRQAGALDTGGFAIVHVSRGGKRQHFVALEHYPPLA